MKELSVVVYTMKGCPFCTEFKDMLVQEGIEFYDRDIDEYKEEYEIYTQLTENEMIPALLIIESKGKKHESYLYAPDRDYTELTEAVELVKKHKKNFGVI